MQADQLETVTPFLIERLRAGDDLRDGIILRTSELLNLPARPIWSDSNTIEGAKDAWASNPLAARRDESGEDWARMLEQLPPMLEVTDLADLRPRAARPSFLPLLSVLKPLPDEISVYGVGTGTVPVLPKPGVPRARAAGIAALTTYWRAMRRFMIALPPDVARAASESLRVLLADRLTSVDVARLNEAKAELEFIEARRNGVDPSVAKRVFEAQAAGRPTSMGDVAFLFVHPSGKYERQFERIVGREARLELYQAYVRGGAFDELLPRLSRDPSPGAVALVDGAGIAIEGDREIDVGLAPTVPLVIGGGAWLVPRAAVKVRGTLTHNGDVEDVDERSAFDSRLFRWARPPRGGVYRVRVEALDADGAVIAVGHSGELRVTQFAHCVRCPQRIDFSRSDIDDRTCVWSTSPRPGTPPTTVDSEDLDLLARYGSNERIRKAADTAWRSGRLRGKIVVSGEPAAPSVEYLGTHSAGRLLPDMPRISEMDRYLRGSLVVRHKAEMLELEAKAADRAALRDDRDLAVEILRLRLEGRDPSENRHVVGNELRRTAKRLARDLADVRADLKLFVDYMEKMQNASVTPADPKLAKDWENMRDFDELEAKLKRFDVDKVDENELQEFVNLSDRNKSFFDGALSIIVRTVDGLSALIGKMDFRAQAGRRFLDSTIGDERVRQARKVLEDAVVEAEIAMASQKSSSETETTKREAKNHVEDLKTEIDALKKLAQDKLLRIEEDRQAAALATVWNTGVGALVAKIEQLDIAPSIVARGKQFVVDRGGTLDRNDVDALLKMFEDAESSYKSSGDEAKALYDELERFVNSIPVGADGTMVSKANDAIAEKPAKLDSWREQEEEAKRLSSDWLTIVGAHFKGMEEFEKVKNKVSAIMKELGGRELIEAADFDTRMSAIEDEGKSYLRDFERLQVSARESDLVATRLDATLKPRPSSPIIDFEKAALDAKKGRTDFLEEEARRARETGEDAKRRRLQEFESDADTIAFDAAIAEVEKNVNAFKGKRIAPDFASVIALNDELEKVVRLKSAVQVPSGTPSDEAEAFLRDRVDALKAVEDVRRDDRWKSAIAAESVRLHSSGLNLAAFLQRSPENAEKQKAVRLKLVARARDIIDATMPFVPEIASLRVGIEKLSETIELNGATAISRLGVQKLAQDFIADIAEATNELALDRPLTDDLKESTTLLLETSERRSARYDALSAANDELREAAGKHAREFSKDEKGGVSTDAATASAILFVEYATASGDDEDARLLKMLETFEQSSDVLLALEQIVRLKQEGETLATTLRIRARQHDAFTDLNGRIENVPVPAVADLEKDRSAAMSSIKVVEALKIEIANFDPSRTDTLLASLRGMEADIWSVVSIARTEALARITAAFTISRYGGSNDADALEARNFLEIDEALYGPVTFPPGSEDQAILVATLNAARGTAIGPDRCSPTAYVKSGALTCALDSIVMLAARADPQIMGRMLVSRLNDLCTSEVSTVFRRIDERIGQGLTSESTCDDLRSAMLKCKERDPDLKQILFEAPAFARQKDVLDVADVLGWLNSRYEIESTQLLVEEHIVPQSTLGILVPLPSRDVRHQISWPYTFSSELFTGSAFHEVEVEVEKSAEPPRSFAIRSGTVGAVDELVRLARDKKMKLEMQFQRWGWAYELVAIVHRKPGHYWISISCAGEWSRYDGTKRGQGQLRKLVGNDPRDAEGLASMHMLFYRRTVRLSGTGTVTEV